MSPGRRRRSRGDGPRARGPLRRARGGLLFLALLPLAAPAAAQTVETVGSSDVALDRRLDRLLDGDPLIITSNTRIRAGDTIPRSVLVLDATVIHEGTILGDLVLVDAGVFVRPRAVVTGDLVNIGGGLYWSRRARVGGTILDEPGASYRVIREPDRFVIEASHQPSPVTLDGLYGVRIPTYDRVNGVGVAWGAGLRLPRLGDLTSELRAHGGWRTQPGEPLYGASLTARLGAWSLEGGYEWGSGTHDDWIFRDLRNSLNYLWDGEDYRNYYDMKRSWVALNREMGDEAKSFHAVLRVVGQVEDAESVPGGDPWHLFGDPARSNPRVDDGRITSLLGRLDVEWHGRHTDLEAGAEYEAAREWEGGEFAFDRVAAWADFAMQGLLNHTLEVRAFGQLPLGQDTLPRQRWTFVGGTGTLQTLPLARYRGDHALLVESRYRIPTPDALSLPVLGAPELQLVHVAGMAWLADEDRKLVQEVGGRVQFFGLYVQYMVEPADTEKDALVVGLSWPFEPGFPWER